MMEGEVLTTTLDTGQTTDLTNHQSPALSLCWNPSWSLHPDHGGGVPSCWQWKSLAGCSWGQGSEAHSLYLRKLVSTTDIIALLILPLLLIYSSKYIKLICIRLHSSRKRK